VSVPQNRPEERKEYLIELFAECDYPESGKTNEFWFVL
jgi:hypothetical protein